MSCPSPGNCGAGGSYDGNVNGVAAGEPFVVNEVNGVWHNAIPVPGILALNTGKNGSVSSVSCTQPGDCSAGGSYVGPNGARAFVVNEVNGVWHNAITLPLTASSGAVGVTALACASVGNCSATATDTEVGITTGMTGAYVVNEVNGTWQRPVEIPGKADFFYGALASFVSCPSAGNCTAAGWYDGSQERFQAFVVSEVNGIWHNYIALPGTSAITSGGGSQVTALSCPTPGNCAVAGSYGFSGFLASETNGYWHTAKPVPGIANLYGTGTWQVSLVSCPTAGNCVAAGTGDDAGTMKGFVVSEVNGYWHNATYVPGMRSLDPSGNGPVTALSCPSAGNCSAGGVFYDYDGTSQGFGFVVNEVNGTWHNAIEVPGMSALNTSGSAQVTALSCAKAGECSAGGYYKATHYGLYAGQVFVANEG